MIARISTFAVTFWNICRVSIPFFVLSLISSDFTISAFCCFIFLFTLSKPYLINISTIFVISTFIDIYNTQFIGISFFQFLFIYLAIIQFRILLLNSRIIFGIYFFCLLMIASEVMCFFITAVLLRKSFDLSMHFEHIAVAVFLCCLYCSIAFVNRKIKG